MIKTILDKLKIPNSYRLYKYEKEIPPVPFAVWWIDSETFSGSDETWLIKESNYVVEVYTSEKDFTLEENIENLIPSPDFEKTEDYLKSQNVFCIRLDTGSARKQFCDY